MSDGMGREFAYLSSHATNRYFIPNWGHDLHKKIDGIYDMLMLRHERETEQKGSSAINEKLLDNQDLCLLFQISPRSLQRYRSLGVLPYKRLGQKTYYTEEDVMQFVENNVKEFKKENVEHYLTRIIRKSNNNSIHH